jgi:inorganic pyrophosphatase
MTNTAPADAIVVIVEIPTGCRNKYEYDHEHHVINLDRRLFTATCYPADYGFVPDTLAEDGDPLDALVIVPEPTFPGCHIRATPVGMLTMSDENGPDHKIIAVPTFVTAEEGVTTLADLPANLLSEIHHFFRVYKELERDKATEVGGFDDAPAAQKEIAASRQRFGGGAATTG